MHPRTLDAASKADWIVEHIGYAIGQVDASVDAFRREAARSRTSANMAIDCFAVNLRKLVDFLDHAAAERGRKQPGDVGFEDFVPQWSAPPLDPLLAVARSQASKQVMHLTEQCTADESDKVWNFDAVAAAIATRLLGFLQACNEAGLDVERLRDSVVLMYVRRAGLFRGQSLTGLSTGATLSDPRLSQRLRES